MQEYLVQWTIEIDAESPEDAAKQALAIQRDPNSWATAFTVFDADHEDHHVDLR